MKLGYFRIWGGGGVKEIRISEFSNFKHICRSGFLTKNSKNPDTVTLQLL